MKTNTQSRMKTMMQMAVAIYMRKNAKKRMKVNMVMIRRISPT